MECGIRNADLMQKVEMFKSKIPVCRQAGEIYTEGIPLGKSKICPKGTPSEQYIPKAFRQEN